MCTPFQAVVETVDLTTANDSAESADDAMLARAIKESLLEQRYKSKLHVNNYTSCIPVYLIRCTVIAIIIWVAVNVK